MDAIMWRCPRKDTDHLDLMLPFMQKHGEVSPSAFLITCRGDPLIGGKYLIWGVELVSQVANWLITVFMLLAVTLMAGW